MTRLVMLDAPEPGDDWMPFSRARPVAELRAGAFRIWERWARLLDATRVEVISPATPGFADVDSAPLVAATDIVGPATVARSNFAPIGQSLRLPAGIRSLSANGSPVAWVLGAGERWAGPTDSGGGQEIRGMRLTMAADLVTACERLLEDDCTALLADGTDDIPAGAVVLGDPARVAVRTPSVEPHVIFDVRKGPIVLEPDSVVRAGSRLEGPLYLGHHSWILGGTVRHTAVGPHCRVHGEVSTTVFNGYANKSHDGFIGHSVVGQWVNLGAGTITSNLKNTYGPIRLDLPSGRIETSRMLLGSLIGDHAKTGIGTLLSTGTVIGPASSVIGAPPGRYVRPFAWDRDRLLTLEGFLAIARRVMPRRGVDLTVDLENGLRALHGRLAR